MECQHPGQVREFHKYFYENWNKSLWMGEKIVQYPTDMILIQEIIWKNRPDYIIETGTNTGGSAIYYASIMELMGKGHVITIDKKPNINTNSAGWKRMSSRITSITANSLKADIQIPSGAKTMVILDSCHRCEYVYQEMIKYGKLVTKGNYMIIQDTDLNGNPVRPEWGEGPMEAIQKYMKEHNDFIIDSEIEKRYFLTCSPSGFLKKC